MTERAIDRMVKIIDSDEMTGEENANILWRKLRREARRLAQEDKAHKAEAPDNTLVEALEKLARLGNGSEYGNSDGNRIAQEALAKFKENK